MSSIIPYRTNLAWCNSKTRNNPTTISINYFQLKRETLMIFPLFHLSCSQSLCKCSTQRRPARAFPRCTLFNSTKSASYK
ncbi:hypothetical protein EDC63_10553 [Sulfurirhabdus autotrophica]|uniref:Uncharacterized protein n=1 Tax=Sulfurirhabdus autotrophica TaxID=1706046 RepID=A0A4R3Y566_9PROT|nr:hypothetical protein EDC63_10553 [Sulfurirhabdus autotrophica]